MIITENALLCHARAYLQEEHCKKIICSTAASTNQKIWNIELLLLLWRKGKEKDLLEKRPILQEKDLKKTNQRIAILKNFSVH